MSNWNEVTAAAPELAADVQARFEAHGLGLLATLRADGSPRISGVEPWFAGGELWLGMMYESRKALDLLRDGRLAVHSATADKDVTDGDARISGVASAVDDASIQKAAMDDFEAINGYRPDDGPMHLFRVDVTELMWLKPDGDHLLIRSWTPERGERSVERR